MTTQASVLSVPASEFTRRADALRSSMGRQGLDLLVIFSNLLDPGHVRYLSDFSPINESAAVIFPREGEPILCSGQACQAWSKHTSKIRDVRILPEVGEVAGTEYEVGEQFDFAELFREVKSRYAVRKIGIVGSLIFPQVIYRKMTDAFPGVTVENAEPLLVALRAIKTPAEIACMRQAARIIDGAFRAVTAKLAAGWTELAIQAEIEAEVLRGGAESTAIAWDPMIPTGPERTQLCMNRNSLRQVQEGELIDLQAGAVYEGYNAALCTPVVLGEVPASIRKAIVTANHAMAEVLGALKPGASTRTVNLAGRKVIERGGYGGSSPYGMIHSTGLLECESPWLPVDKDFELRPGMTMCIDIFLFRLPFGSFRIEDTAAITDTGVERLTSFNRSYLDPRYA